MICCLLFVLTACNKPTMYAGNPFDEKGSLVGDNSAVIRIVKEMPDGEYVDEIHLQTKKEPYGIALNYKNTDKFTTDEQIQELATMHAAYLFALVKNADEVTFHFPTMDEFVMTREELEKKFGMDLRDIEEEEELQKLIENKTK